MYHEKLTYETLPLGNEDQTIQGLQTTKIGQSTGITTGNITSRYRTALGKTDCIEYSNSSIPGDSGGPVYYDDGHSLYLIAMNFAGPAQGNPNIFGVGCRITEVMHGLDVTIIAENDWSQPSFASHMNSHGTITSSGPILPGEDSWRAFDGIISGKTNGTYFQWTANATQGYIELQLNYYIKVYQIDFYQRVSSTSNRDFYL